MSNKFSQKLFSVSLGTDPEGEGERFATGKVYYNDSRKQLSLSLVDEVVEDRGNGFISARMQPLHPLNWSLAIGQPMARYSEKKCQAVFDSLDAEKIKDFYLAHRSPNYRFNTIPEAQGIWDLLP